MQYINVTHCVENCCSKQNFKVYGNRNHTMIHYKDRQRKPNLVWPNFSNDSDNVSSDTTNKIFAG